MNSKEIYAIREWAPLPVIEKIPARMQRGFFPADVDLTCVDAVGGFLALGSALGVVFWYNRHTGAVQKLKAEVPTRITCVAIVDSVEFMVAAGHSSGQVSVFQIQKELPDDLNLVAPCTRAKPIERYTIRELHRSSVSCCEWSKNGMKLYSGDRFGVVVLTEFDYQTHLSKSVEIIAEAYEIVQLSVHQSYLLVSTLYRSIVCHRTDATGEWHITQVGTKDRKQLVDCGGTFLKRHTKRPLLICGRPGLRFWVADTEGAVEKTLLFREAVTRSPTWEIPILNPKTMVPLSSTPNRPPPLGSPASGEADDESGNGSSSNNFAALYLYAGQDSLVVTHDGATLYLLDLDSLRVEAVARGFRKILDFCVCEKEIFVLEGKRSLARLAPLPEKPNKTAKIIFNPLMPPPVPLLGAASVGTFEAPAEDAVIRAEECFELPPIEAITLKNIPIELAVESPRAEQNRRLEIFQQISEMDFDQSILHHSGSSSQNGRKQRKNRGVTTAKSEGIVEIAQAADGVLRGSRKGAGAKLKQADELAKPKTLELTTQPTLMDASFCTSAYVQHLPDLLSPATLQRTIEAKAKTLAEELQLPQVCLGPITDEELRAASASQTQVAAFSPPSAISTASATPASLMQLSHVYPSHVEDAGVQTTPRKRNYYLHDDANEDDEEPAQANGSAKATYSAGEPIEDMCQTLLLAQREEKQSSIPVCVSATNAPLQFVAAPPQQNEEIDSFLLDFRRARDPLQPHEPPPPLSAESNTSSEWEFLDN